MGAILFCGVLVFFCLRKPKHIPVEDSKDTQVKPSLDENSEIVHGDIEDSSEVPIVL
jgi:hypothetical protein